jgi:hypothetical protein
MARSIRVEKTVVSKDDFNKVVDTEFTSFVDPVIEESTDTLENLFRLYEKLYYEIPIDGPENSHTFLITESSKLADIEKDLSEIQPLLDEISQLREQLLLTNKQLIDAEFENETNAKI